tara:strand:- start:123 stop:716 length:594 start_codon:yes stop_codon:yes gene_type:complete
MLEKDKFLEKINSLIVVFLVFFPMHLDAANIESKLLKYNNKLQNTSALFIQSSSRSIEEGVIYFGKERIKIDYLEPRKLTIIISEKKGVYIDHDLEESQYFNSNKSYVRVFFKIFNSNNSIDKLNIEVSNNLIKINEIIEIEDNTYKINFIYENNPIILRKIIVVENNESFELGLFNHENTDKFHKNFFSMVDPYLN